MTWVHALFLAMFLAGILVGWMAADLVSGLWSDTK